MSTQPGNLIVFEGVDGAGKTTLAKELTTLLQQQNIPCEYLAFPGRNVGTLGFHVYQLHHDMANYGISEIDPLSLQLLHVAAHVDEIKRQIRPKLLSGISIVLDRFWWSTLVYGKVAGAKEKQLRNILRIEQEEWKSIRPLALFMVTRIESLNPANQGHSDLSQIAGGLRKSGIFRAQKISSHDHSE